MPSGTYLLPTLRSCGLPWLSHPCMPLAMSLLAIRTTLGLQLYSLCYFASFQTSVEKRRGLLCPRNAFEDRPAALQSQIRANRGSHFRNPILVQISFCPRGTVNPATKQGILASVLSLASTVPNRSQIGYRGWGQLNPNHGFWETSSPV